MRAFYDGLNEAVLSPVASRSMLYMDQWVSTDHNGTRAVGRIRAVLDNPHSGRLYEVELPLQTSRGGMTRVVRFPHEVSALDSGTAETPPRPRP